METLEEMAGRLKVRRIKSESRMIIMQVGGGSTGGASGDPGTGGAKQSTAGCFLNVRSERPWVADIYLIKDSLAEQARAAKVIKPGENFPDSS